MAWASADEEVRIDFLGFSTDCKMAMVRITDPNSGNRITVFTIPKAKSVASKPFYSAAQEKKIKAQLAKKYRIKDPGKNSNQDPKGKITFFGLLKGKWFRIMAMRGNRTAAFDKVAAGKAGQVSLKEVWWAKDGRSMVMIINKKRSDPDYGFNIDVLRFYRYYPSTLHFK